MAQPPKILAVASNGGHWHQLQQIVPALDGAEVIFASTSSVETASKADFHADEQLSDYSQKELRKLIPGFFEAFKLVKRIRPDVVISSGAAPGLMCLLAGRLLGAKTIWMDSIANAEEMSLSGRIAPRFCHVVLTQWEHLQVPGKVQYWGSVV